jgi:predicted ester cyclase
MAQDNASIVRGFVDEVITKGNIEAAAHYVWEDVVEQVPLPGQGPGLDGLKDILRAMRSGFPDIVFSVQEQVAEHDKVASRFEWTGTHNGEFLGIPAQDGLCASGELSLIAWRMAVLRTLASLWILLA